MGWEVVVKYITAVIFILILSIGVSLLFAYPLMLLWNWLMPKIFGLSAIKFWEAFGIEILSGLLFGKVNFNRSN